MLIIIHKDTYEHNTQTKQRQSNKQYTIHKDTYVHSTHTKQCQLPSTKTHMYIAHIPNKTNYHSQRHI